MAWLRDLMTQAKPPLRSYDQLAERALARPEWPSDKQPQPRSLAALFSKFDRGLELEWLSHRPAIQQALAATLGCPLSSLLENLKQGIDATYVDQHRFRFDDSRFARPLELREEALPPGIPAVLSDPQRWDRLWWDAPSGSGRTLVGRWLESRGLARYVAANSIEDVTASITAATKIPLFVEIDAHQHFELPRITASTPICVAASFAPTISGWTRLASAPVADFIDQLFAWLELRLPSDGHFEKEAALSWTRQVTASGLLGTFGAVIGLAGLIDEVGVAAVRDKSLTALSTWFVAQRLKQAGAEGNPDAHWLLNHGFQILTGLARRALTDSPLPWTASRSHDDWIALVPTELQRGVDVDWLRLSLAKAAGPSANRDLERALRKLPPGAFGVIRGLQAAHLLRSAAGSDALKIAPHWLNLSALEVAVTELCNESPFEWGEALLSAHAAPLILQRLSHDIEAGKLDAIEKTLELGARENPASAAATEACFRVVGAAVLGGQEIPTETIETLYREQLTLLIELPERLPEPRVLHPDPVQPLCDRGLLYLAALALSERIEARSAPRHSLLNPWGEDAADPRLVPLLDEVARALEHAVDARQTPTTVASRNAMFALVDRLSHHFIEQQPSPEDSDTVPSIAVFRDDDGRIHPLELPSSVLRAFASGTIENELLAGLERYPAALQGLEFLCAERQLVWAGVAKTLWLGWVKSKPLSVGFFDLTLDSDAKLWPHAPKEVFDELPSLNDRSSKIPFDDLIAEQWPWVPLELFRQTVLWDSIPVTVALEKLESLAAEHLSVGLAALWQRAPTELTAFVARVIEQQRDSVTISPRLERAFSVLLAAPDVETPTTLPVLSAMLARTGLPVLWVDQARAWLLGRIARRAPEWRTAYTLLAKIERRLRR